MITTVVLDGLDDRTRRGAALDAVVASLPVSLAPARRGESGAVVVHGSLGWPLRVQDAILVGATAVVVVDPVVTTDVPDVAVPVAIDRTHGSRPGVCAVASAVAAIEVQAVLELRSFVGPDQDLSTALLEQFFIARTVTGSRVVSAVPTTCTSHGCVVRGRLQDGRRIWCTVERTAATDAMLSVRMVGSCSTVLVEVPSSRTARPVKATITDEHGSRLLPTEWETSHRASWRRVHDALQHGALLPDLQQHRDDSEVLAQGVSGSPSSAPQERR